VNRCDDLDRPFRHVTIPMNSYVTYHVDLPRGSAVALNLAVVNVFACFSYGRSIGMPKLFSQISLAIDVGVNPAAARQCTVSTDHIL